MSQSQPETQRWGTNPTLTPQKLVTPAVTKQKWEGSLQLHWARPRGAGLQGSWATAGMTCLLYSLALLPLWLGLQILP